ncbi:hypothetical protein EBGED10_57510 [Bacillus sp. GeD10]|nr:hypothetical protein EBGED10_57510 [Bacillus sp. GeD10]
MLFYSFFTFVNSLILNILTFYFSRIYPPSTICTYYTPYSPLFNHTKN